MSKLYGTVRSESNKLSTRCAHRQIVAAAQSWEGSLTVSIEIDTNGHHTATIGIAEKSQNAPDITLWRGPLSLLIRAKEIRLDTTHDFGFNGVNPANKKPRKQKEAANETIPQAAT